MKIKIAINICRKSLKWMGFLNDELSQKLNLPDEFKSLLLGIHLTEHESKKIIHPHFTLNSIRNSNVEISIVLPWSFNDLSEDLFVSKLQNFLNTQFCEIKESNEEVNYNYEKLNDDDFWRIFENKNELIHNVYNKLQKHNYQFLISFEITLRNKIQDINSDYLLNILVKDSIITDDSFLYIRLHIILKGRNTYQKILDKIDLSNIEELFNNDDEGERLMYLTDDIFFKKYSGKGMRSPRDIANDILDINLI